MSKITVPAEDRPYTIPLSSREVHALVKFNLSQMRRVGKVFSQKGLEITATNPFGSGRELMLLRRLCQDEVKKYYDRAKGLASIIKK